MFAAMIPAGLVAGTHLFAFAFHHHHNWKGVTMSHTFIYASLAAYESLLVGVTFGLGALGLCPTASTWADGHVMQIIAVVAVVAMVAVIARMGVSVIREELKRDK
jgi:hypothetical protein